MKNFTKVLFIAIAMFGFATSSFAQADATASASATATIIKPIAIVKVTDMVFGNIVVQPGAVAQTVTLDADADANASHSSLVTLPSFNAVTPTAAEFTVSGANLYTYNLDYPATITLGGSTGVDMSVSLTCNVIKTAGVLSASGSETLYIGGTLTIGTDQVAEVYTTATDFDVTVDYN